jgi:hypothetical protein
MKLLILCNFINNNNSFSKKEKVALKFVNAKDERIKSYLVNEIKIQKLLAKKC